MYKFFLNWMGPVSLRWYEDKGIPYEVKWVQRDDSPLDKVREGFLVKEYKERYRCGRIDVSGGDLMFNHEISVPIMKDTSWRKLMVWLHDLELDYIPMGKGIFTMFEEDTGHKIEWWNK